MPTSTVKLPEGRTGNTITIANIVERAEMDAKILGRMIDDPKSFTPASRRRWLIAMQDNLATIRQLRALDTDYDR